MELTDFRYFYFFTPVEISVFPIDILSISRLIADLRPTSVGILYFFLRAESLVVFLVVIRSTGC
jgi:hypothetical protein